MRPGIGTRARACWTALAVLTSLSGVARADPPPSSPPSDSTPATPPATEPNTKPERSPPPHGVGASDLTPSDAERLRFLQRPRTELPVVGLQVGDTRYATELATTDASRARGMGGRSAFPPGTAMLFVNPNDIVRRYWMLDCLVDIDVAFIDRFGRITAMHRMKAAPPRGSGERIDRYTARLPRYSSRRPARYALELPSGELSRLGLKVGQTIPLPHRPLQAMAR